MNELEEQVYALMSFHEARSNATVSTQLTLSASIAAASTQPPGSIPSRYNSDYISTS